MFEARTLKILFILLAGYALLAIPAYWGPPFLEEFSSLAVIVPLLSVHAFHRLGIPGLLEHGGYCGWGMCSPTAFGWGFLALFWMGAAWLAAWGIARLTSPSTGR
jgi:hypothetical protein